VGAAALDDDEAMSTSSIDPRTTPREALSELFWFGVVSVLAMTTALVVLAGVVILANTTLQIVIGVLAFMGVAHAWNQYHWRYELRKDPRLIHARERRGF
jgi:membrane protein YdbS with pleckstrin-like domain